MATSLLVLGPAIALVVLQVPRAVAPHAPPALVISPIEAEAALDRDRQAAREAPEGEAVVALLRLHHEGGLAEATARPETQEESLARRAAIDEARRAVVAAHGEGALDALRAAAAIRLDDALAGRMSRDELRGFLGGLPRMLERYGVTKNRRLIAPRTVARALFEASWNGRMGIRPLTAGLDRVELRAYWGWLALHSAQAEMDARLAALDEYRRAGGTRVIEARAALLWQAERYEASAGEYARAYEHTGSLRLRNHGLAALRQIE